MARSLQLTAHYAYNAYDAQVDNYMQWVYLEDEKAPAPLPAAEDRSARLRYPVKGRLILALTRLLPDSVWRSLLGGGMTRRPGRRAGRTSP